MKKQIKHWRESEIFDSLKPRFGPEAFCLLPQVRNGTGFSRQVRTADAMAVSMWPSRGLYLTGFEFKATKADWRKELKDPAKSESIQAYCRHWYVVAPKSVVDLAELPKNWGLLECNSRGTKLIKLAPDLEETPLDMPMFCSFLRSITKATVPALGVQAKIKKQVEAAVAAATGLADQKLEELREALALFEKESGVKIGDRWDLGNTGKAVAFLKKHGPHHTMWAAKRMQEQAAVIVKAVDKFAEGCGMDLDSTD